jgi:hypothetical protein
MDFVDRLAHGGSGDLGPDQPSLEIDVRLHDRRPWNGEIGELGQLHSGEQRSTTSAPDNVVHPLSRVLDVCMCDVAMRVDCQVCRRRNNCHGTASIPIDFVIAARFLSRSRPLAGRE